MSIHFQELMAVQDSGKSIDWGVFGRRSRPKTPQNHLSCTEVNHCIFGKKAENFPLD
jgi:hypothetical protein